MKMTKHSNVMTLANNLVKQGCSRSKAMIKAWILIRLETVNIKVTGVTIGKRQEAIEHLMKYKPSDIIVQLKREKRNPYDKNAIAVVATVKGKGSYHMVYLPRLAASFLSPVLDKQRNVYSRFKNILGNIDSKLGLAIEVRI